MGLVVDLVDGFGPLKGSGQRAAWPILQETHPSVVYIESPGLTHITDLLSCIATYFMCRSRLIANKAQEASRICVSEERQLVEQTQHDNTR